MVAKRVHGKQTVAVGLTGAKLKSAKVAGHTLVITASRPASQLTVTLTALRESASLKAAANAKKLKGLKLGVVVRNAKGKTTAASTALTLKS